MARQKIFIICPQCKGSKTISINDESYDPGPTQVIDCPSCSGTGRIHWGWLKVEAEEE